MSREKRRAEESDSEDETSSSDDDEEVVEQAGSMALTCNVFAMLIGGGLFGFSLHTGVAAQGTAWTAYVSGALGMLLLLLSCFGCVGLCSGNKKLLSTYFAALMFAVLAIFVSGGYSLLMTEQVAGWVRANWDKFASDTRTEESVTEDIRQNMRIIAGITGALVLVGVYLMYETGAKITKLKALTLFLEVANVITLPMGILLVVAALYIADTAAVATAPITAFALFMVGCFVVSISLLGCFGTAIGSRGLILFFMSTVAVLSVVMAAMGIFAFVSADALKRAVEENWDEVRLVLPHTFSGRYDREVFTSFVDANLKGMGFLSITMALLLAGEVLCCRELRKELKQITLARQRAAEEEAAAHSPGRRTPKLGEIARQQAESRRGQGMFDSMRVMTQQVARLDLQETWKNQWTHGTKKSRCCIKTTCALTCTIIFLVVCAATLGLVFATSCTSFSSFRRDLAFQAPSAGTTRLRVESNYTRGTVSLRASDSETAGSFVVLHFNESAIDERSATAPDPEFLSGSGAGGEPAGQASLRVQPGETKPLFSFDPSCQAANVAVHVPRGPSAQGLIMELVSRSEYDGVDAQLPSHQRLELLGLRASTTQGSIALRGLDLGPASLRAASSTGEVYLTDSSVTCDAGSEELVHLVTELGGVHVDRSTFINCALDATSTLSPILLDDVRAYATVGNPVQMRLSTLRGMIEVKNSVVDTMDLTSPRGGVRVESVNASASVLIAADQGFVRVRSLRVGGNVQIETTTGAVELHIARGGFSGTISINTGGAVTVEGDAVTYNAQQRSGRINCNAQCAYYGGEILITSSTGRVHVRAD